MRGKVRFNVAVQYGIEDHPRLCGEKSCDDRPVFVVLGSPPPMRGKVTSTVIIP